MYSNILAIIEKIARHPQYGLVGIASERLVYGSTKEGSTDLWTANLDGSNEKLLAKEIILVARPRSRDKRIYYTLDVAKGRELHKIYVVDLDGNYKDQALEMDAMRIFGLVHYNDKVIFSGATKRDNALYIGEDGGKAEKIYSSDKWIFVTDADDKYIIGAGTLAGDPRSMEIFIYSLKTQEFRVYTPRKGSYNQPSMLYNGKIIFISDFEGDKRIYLYNIEKDSIETPRLEGEEYKRFEFKDYIECGYTEDGKIWFIGLQDYRGYAFLDGYLIYHPEGTPENIHTYNSDIYITFSSLKSPYAIYRTGFDESEWKRVVGEELDKDILDRLGDVKIVKYKSFDGLEIPTVIYESNAPKPGPTILYVHGGPWSYVGDYWRALIVGLVATGFHVIAPNFRGSTGYGEEFRKLDIGDPGGGDLKDIVYARKYAFDTGLANKIAIMGYSYGGFMTYLATVKEPDLWDAGVAGAGITDWEMMYEQADAAFRHFQEILFDRKRELWRDRSAIHYVDNLKAPLCILHPQNDTRTPLKPVLKYMEKLIEKGKTFEAHIMPDVGHMMTRVEDIIKLLYPAIVFLNKILKK